MRRSSGVNNTLRQSLSIQSVTWDNLWEKETLQLKPGDRQRGSTKINIDTLTFDVCLFPASSSVPPWLQTTSYSRTPPGSPDSLRPSPQEIFFRGTRRLIEMAKWVLAEPTTDTVSAWDEVISSCRITLFSDIPWNSNTWLSISGFTHLFNLSLTHYNFDEFVCQQWRQHDLSRNRWGTKLKISSFQNLASLDLFTHLHPQFLLTITQLYQTHHSIRKLQRNSQLKRKLRRVYVCTPSLDNVLLVNTSAAISEHNSSSTIGIITGVWSSCALWTLVISMWNNHRWAERIENRKED